MIQPWTATCMQVYCHTVNSATNREEAMAIVNKSLDRWITLAMGTARGDGSHLLLYPEFALTGFPLLESAEEWIEKACIEIPGPETGRLQKAAQDLKCYIGANSYEKDPEWPDRYFNCSYLIDPSGDVILKYRRINTVHTASPHDFMDAYLDKYGLEGTFPVSETPLGNIAMMPCGEIMYPESARMFMFRGAEVLLHPTSDHGAADKWAWESAKKVRASENMMYLVSTNATGQIGTFIPEGQTLGNSKIIDYHGRVLENVGGPGESTVASATIDVEALRRERRIPGAGNRLLRQRIEMYRPLYNQTSFYPPNQFADAPMDSKQRIMEIQQEALGNMAEAGIVNLPEVTE
ncbi:MAG: nitrilase-related carbon-nitrogen hydrolase [Rhodospirillaceae bacterium]|jgi:predicted amidohydrolase|nr:nitrilase-related carbon-nitrogen hydrolase [Rhodospirillaceae bacterium]